MCPALVIVVLVLVVWSCGSGAVRGGDNWGRESRKAAGCPAAFRRDLFVPMFQGEDSWGHRKRSLDGSAITTVLWTKAPVRVVVSAIGQPARYADSACRREPAAWAAMPAVLLMRVCIDLRSVLRVGRDVRG